MKILLGTTNPSKAKRYKELLKGIDIQFVTLNDLNITDECEETGKDPKENAMLKAAFYGKYADYVITGDSALYIKDLPLNHPLQPGLEIRRKKGF